MKHQTAGRNRPLTQQELADALNFLNPDCPRDEWIKCLFGFKRAGGALDAFTAWSAQCPRRFDKANLESSWRNDRGGITERSFFHALQSTGWKDPRRSETPASRRRSAPKGMPATEDEAAALDRLVEQAFDWMRRDQKFSDRRNFAAAAVVDTTAGLLSTGHIKTLTTTYEYRNRDNELWNVKTRTEKWQGGTRIGKTFRQDIKEGIETAPYLAQWFDQAAGPVYVTEGEKDAETLFSLRLMGTCDHCGISGWPGGWGGHFQDASVVICTDAPKPPKGGEKPEEIRRQERIRKIYDDMAPFAARIFEFPIPAGAPPGSDITDWLRSGLVKWGASEAKEPPPGCVRLTERPAVEEWKPPENESAGASEAVLRVPERFKDLTNPPCIAGDLCPRGVYSLLFGPGGAGKTSFCLQMALCLAAGVSFCGQPVRKSGRSIFMSLETGDRRREQLLTIQSRDLGIDLDSVWDDLIVLDWPPGMRLATAESAAFMSGLASAVKDAGAVFVFLDPLIFLLPGDENSASDAGAVAAELNILAESTGAAVLAATHPRKRQRGDSGPFTAEDLRGSSAQTAGARQVIAFCKATAEQKGDDQRPLIAVEIVKNNEGPSDRTFFVERAASPYDGDKGNFAAVSYALTEPNREDANCGVSDADIDALRNECVRASDAGEPLRLRPSGTKMTFARALARVTNREYAGEETAREIRRRAERLARNNGKFVVREHRYQRENRADGKYQAVFAAETDGE